MPAERVSCIQGKKPIILICPHGCDDTNTADIARETAAILNCYAVINQGFERADIVDVDKDKADCNRVDHVKEAVVYEEFLKPIYKFQTKIANKSNKMTSFSWDGDPVHIFHIHGCGNHVHKEAGENVEVIIGYGLGSKKDNLSCDEWRKNLLVDLYRTKTQGNPFCGEIYEGKGGGRYAGRDSNNMNQYFRKHYNFENVHSMQLEFPFSKRDIPYSVMNTSKLLASVLTDYVAFTSYHGNPQNYFI